MRGCDPNPRHAGISEAKTSEKILAMAPCKWRIIRLFDTLARLLGLLLHARSSPGDPRTWPATILVLEYWHLGDLAILIPFLRNLRNRFPRARISLMGNVACAPILDGQGILDEFIPVRVPWARHFNRWRKYNPFSFDWLSLIGTLLALRKRQFDWAFSGRMDVRDNLLIWLIGARRRIGYGFCGGSFLLTDPVVPDLSRPHRADVWLHLLDAIDLPLDSKSVSLQLADTELAVAQSNLASLGIPPDCVLIGVHPGARVSTRRWGDERFAEVARQILNDTDAHILWFSEPGRSGEAPSWERCHEVSLSLRPFLVALSRCRLLLCNDSGPMHLANLLGVPVVAVFGPQRPEWFGPRGAQDHVVIHSEFPCRPCSDYCIFDQPYCLRTITSDEVYEGVQDVLQQLTGASAKTSRSQDMEALASHKLQHGGGLLA